MEVGSFFSQIKVILITIMLINYETSEKYQFLFQFSYFLRTIVLKLIIWNTVAVMMYSILIKNYLIHWDKRKEYVL